MREKSIGFLLVLFLFTSVFSEMARADYILDPSELDFEYSCLNTTHSYKEAVLYVNETEQKINQTLYCPYGCSNNRCEEGSFINLYIFILIVSISLVLLLVSEFTDNPIYKFIGGLMIMVLSIYLFINGLWINGILYRNMMIKAVSFGLVFLSLYIFYASIIEFVGEEE